MRTSEVLNKAADLIDERGWVQGGNGWGQFGTVTPLCMEGGILAALGTKWDNMTTFEPIFRQCPAYQAVSAYLGLEEWQDVYDYNDEVGRTASEVIATLRACALIEAAREEQADAEATYAENLAVSV